MVRSRYVARVRALSALPLYERGMNPFTSLGLADFLQRATEAQGFTEPTPIQALAIPPVLAGRDVAAEAQTGSGKTAAFALPLLHRLIAAQTGWGTAHIDIVVLVPTRELALQVAASTKALARFAPNPLHVVALIGGQPIEDQITALRRDVHIVVATPGRLQDLLDRGEIDLSHVTALVLDEADKLLDQGFRAAIDALVAAMPSDRQTALFTATLPQSLVAFSEQVLRDPVTVRVDAEPTAVATITHRAFQVDRDARRGLLQHLIADEQWERTLVFVATQRAAENLASKLRKADIRATALHGGLEQDLRIEALNRFRRGNVKVLVATDLAARGIHIDSVDVVVNLDLPRSTRDYTHRVGRTGRAGATGRAVSFVDHDTEAHLRLIEKRTGITMPRVQVPGFELTGEPPARQKGPPPTKGKRMSKKDKLREAARRAAEGADPT